MKKIISLLVTILTIASIAIPVVAQAEETQNKIENLAAVTGLKVASVTHENVCIKWNQIENADCFGVYRSESEEGEYTLIAGLVIKGGSPVYNDDALTVGKEYYYKVCAIQLKGNQQYYGEFSEAVNCTPIPEASELMIRRFSDKKIRLTWENIEAVDGYQVFSSKKNKTGFKKIRTVAANEKELVAINAKYRTNKKVYFKVRAYLATEEGIVYGDFSKAKAFSAKAYVA